MKNRWLSLVSALLVTFTGLVLAWQVGHYDESDPLASSIVQSFIRTQRLAGISDIVERDSQISQGSGANRKHDLALPKEARIFMTDMTGPTNYAKMGYYYFVTYYLFPREVGTSLDHITRMTKDGFVGKTSESDEEILSNGFDIRIDWASDVETTRSLHNLQTRIPVNPEWFDSYFDLVVAFLLPGLTALTGMWLFRFLFRTLSSQLPLLEQLACGLGLGMMAVAALTLAVKLCGFHGRGLVLLVTAAGGILEIGHNRKAYITGITGGGRTIVRSPVTVAMVTAGLLIFLILFRLAGLQGLVEFDAIMGWALKAKILHLYSGSELVQWFSNPRLARAHLDYPTLVPSLQAATFDSIGHVDEFVTKFWPAWMLFFLLGALATMNHTAKSRLNTLYFALLGLLLLPVTLGYAQMEGGTLPMVFFTVLGFGQCALWLIGKNRARLGLGLTLLFGATMAKFEGFIFLALVGGWMLLVPSARPSFKLSPRLWPVLAFCFLAALPFLCLRIQIPVLDYESGWAGYARHYPGSTLANWPGIFLILLARLFVNPGWADWSGESGRFHWIGRWDGFSSLYNHLTLGLAWLCLFMAVALWFAVPARRPIIVWALAMFVGALAAFSGVFASFVNITNLTQVIGYTANNAAGRYLLPVLLAWFATMLIVCFAEDPVAPATVSRLKPGGKSTRTGRKSKP